MVPSGEDLSPNLKIISEMTRERSRHLRKDFQSLSEDDDAGDAPSGSPSRGPSASSTCTDKRV